VRGRKYPRSHEEPYGLREPTEQGGFFGTQLARANQPTVIGDVVGSLYGSATTSRAGGLSRMSTPRELVASFSSAISGAGSP
jgi:hypothetical protein